MTGRILDSTDDAVTLEVGGTKQQVAYADVKKALVQVEFNRRADGGDGGEEA